MDADPEDLLVTTGGQQVIDLVCKTLIDPGDVIVAEAPTYPGAVPTFSSYQADVVQVEMDEDGMRIDVLEAALDRLAEEGRTPKFIYTVPSFQNPAGVTMALDRRRRLVRIAAERELLVLEDNPYGLLRYEGEAQPTLYAPGRRRVRHLPGDVLEDPLARAAPRLGGRAPARAAEAQPRQAGRRPVLVLVRAALRGRLLRPRRLARLPGPPAGALPPPPRRDVRGARGALPGRGDLDAPRGRALPVGHAARLHRHDRPARPRAARARGLRARPRGVPRRARRDGDAAELLRRGRGGHPRGRAADRQGRARAGRALLDAHGRRAGAGARGAGAPAGARGRAHRARSRRRAAGER